jgi:hypothetical protein
MNEQVTITWAGFCLQFQSTRERTKRIADFVLKEAMEAQCEYQQSLKVQTDESESLCPTQ